MTCIAIACTAPAMAASTAFDPAQPVILKNANTASPAAIATASASDVAAPLATRNAFEVSYGDAEDAVGAALSAKGLGDKIAAVISGRKSAPLYAYSKPVTLEVHGLRVDDHEAHHWNASLYFVADNEVISAVPLSGRFEEMVEVPVLKRQVRAGDVISDADIEVKDFGVTQTRADTITDMASLIGKTPVRSISPLRPIREMEIGSPAILKKNSIVQMRFDAPSMHITTTGQAMADGAKGDVIDIRNMASKKIVRAAVLSADSVSIVAPDQQTSELKDMNHATN